MTGGWLRRSDLEGYAVSTGRGDFAPKVWTCLTEFAPSIPSVNMVVRTAESETEIAFRSLVELEAARNVQVLLYREMREPPFFLFKEWVMELRRAC